MKTITKGRVNLIAIAILLAGTVLARPAAAAAPMNNYCVLPPFIKMNVPANLLMLFDNSSSMFDLAYADAGLKHCSNSSATCAKDADCSGGTCSVFNRQPYYCYDETYRSDTTYSGYFDPAKFYYYRSATDDFAEVGSPFPSGCVATKSIPNTMCLQYTGTTVNSFVANGNYLNWLSASKLDVEKKILTGGKYNAGYLLAESRGCVGQGFVKNALTGDFVNFSTTDGDPNFSLGVTFTVHGPVNPNSASAPSQGGPTYISLFSSSTPYNISACQDAVKALASGTNAEIKQAVDACLKTTTPTTGSCQQLSSKSCTTSSECVRNPAVSQTSYVCSGEPTRTCSGALDTTSCDVPARYTCHSKPSIVCTGPADVTGCLVSNAEVLGTCGSYSPTLPNGAKPPTSCRSNSDCTFSKANTTYTGTCSGYTAAGTTDYGPCVGTAASNFNPCVANYVGGCVLPATTVATKTKVSFQQSMQACWALRNGHPIGIDDIKTVINQCTDVYSGLYTCSNNPSRSCDPTVANVCGAGNSCVGGPAAIAPGNPALLCGQSYVGQFFTQSGGAWVVSSSPPDYTAMEAVHTQFCNDMDTPNVTDPTDAASDSSTYDNLPAILSGVGVEAQLGAPLVTMRVRLATTEPRGLLQEFDNQIRFGAMAFNFAGSASEASSLAGAAIKQVRVCSNNHYQQCTLNADCGGTNTCLSAASSASYNLDGGQISDGSYVGQGFCSTMTTTPCSVDGDCGFGKSCLSGRCGTLTSTKCASDVVCASGDNCMASGVGSHAAGLVKVVDNIRGNAWTPLSEAFYEAIGYFARLNDGKSRSDLRLNTADYLDTMNPSQYSCQKNYVLVITDGSSTADQNSSVASLAGSYADAAGVSAATCPSYNGSTYLPVLTWLAQHRKITDFSAAPLDARDYISTFVVTTGGDNGLSGDCNSLTYLGNAASKGGTTLNRANDPAELEAALRDIFRKVAAQSSSGTAASILSNSEGSGANILQAVFFPEKSFDGGTTKVSWAGEMQNLWYFIDPFIGRSSVREDSDYPGSGTHFLNLKSDNVAQFKFNDFKKETEVILSVDADGDGGADLVQPSGFPKTITPDEVKSLWRAGKLLWDRDLTTSPRTIYTQTAGTRTSLTALDTADAAVQGLLQASDQAEAGNIISYVKGLDLTGYRSRTIATSSATGAPRKVWKLGDIVSSTPRVESSVRLNGYNLDPTAGYNDTSYGNDRNKTGFIYSSSYLSRGMAYVGANDGMLHAFRLGVLDVTPSGDRKASLSGTELGKEEWAFIPKNALPYLKYLGDPNYPHLYYIDGTTVLTDVSIGCSDASYWECAKTADTWRTVLIGSMGLGGASRNKSDACTEGTGGSCVKTPVDGVGYSSYFALDVTSQTDPQFLWEFTNPTLGYATTGPAIVRLSASSTVTLDDGTSADVPDKNKNGRWYAVFASGPVGPITSETCQFKGYSDQNLRLFVVDLKTGALLKTIDTGITNAFAGSISSGTVDTDRWEKRSKGFYQDDAVYVGYVKKAADGTWTDGGVLRLVTKESTNVDDWAVSKVIDGIGPVTSSISKLQDRKKHNFWLYFGTGRYYYNQDDKGTSTPPRRLFGVKEPCYKETFSFSGTTYRDKLDPACTDTVAGVAGSLSDKTSDASDALSLLADKGWYIDLEGENVPVNGYGAERIISDPVAMINGVVFFTSFKPTADPCKFGGQSYMWATKYDTGGTATAAALQGKALVQVSTGSFEELDLDKVFTDKGGRRQGTAMTGKPPSDPPPIVTKSNLKPVKKILHIKER